MTTPPTERPALMPCPFCGEAPAVQESYDGPPGAEWVVFCGNDMCGCEPWAGYFVDKAAAITAWNTRHPSPALPTPALAGLADEIADRVCREVCELPDRTSPDDWPEALLVTSDELHAIVKDVCAAPPATLEARVRGLEVEWRKRAAYLRTAVGNAQDFHRCEERADVLTECADALAALITGGENG